MGGMISPAMATRRAGGEPHLRATTAPLPAEGAVFADQPAWDATPDLTMAERARAIYHARRRRDAMLGSAQALFHDPAWDILLDLFVHGEEHQLVSVSSACVASTAPLSTALRCLKAMERAGLIVFERDPFDKRRRFVALSRATHHHLTDWLAEN
ncbi:MAG: hypothetical protein WC804_14945 [Sphingomonas sp.]|jgi:DNA-binding MarR family transcriptional regulator|uniref:hypothetical protein n=1 Tax=Sphingomonas sp. TaxID=28214 RepID=UPI00356AC2F7